MEKLWYLKKCGVFQGLPEDEMQRVSSLAVEHHFARKHLVYSADDGNSIMYILKKGRVRIFKLSAEGKSITLSILKPGDIFGSMSLIEGGTAGAYAETLEDSYICFISQEELLPLIREIPALAIRLIEKINKKLMEAEERIEDLAFRDVPGRISSALLKLSEQFGKKQGDGIRIDIKITHQELADMVGATRETVTVILNEFKSDGVISINEKFITILDIQSLKDWACK